jgi:hypothetical protein
MVKPRYKVLSDMVKKSEVFVKILISGEEVKYLHTSPLFIILNVIILLVGWNSCMDVSH